MSGMNLLLALMCVATVAVWYALWTQQLAATWIPARQTGRRISRNLVVAYLIVNFVAWSRRDDEALFVQGLSLENQVQAVVTAFCVLWALWLLLDRRLRVSALFSGSSFWFTLLLLVYVASTFWSVWPVYTLYRAVELAALWIIGMHIFSQSGWYREVTYLLNWAVIIFLVAGATSLALGISPYADPASALRSNQGSLMAAGLILMGVHQRLFLCQSIPIWQWLLSVGAFVLFGSLASFVALGVALVILTLRYSASLRPMVITVAGLSTVLVGVYLAQQGLDERNTLIRGVAAAFGKTPENILNFTGRIPLWTEIWSITKDKPFGLGFAAGDRAYVVIAASRDSVGWEAGHAHNGYLSAWVGAGVMALAFLGIGLWAIARFSRGLASTERALVLGLLVLLAMNNLTIPAVGGQMSPAWMLTAALSGIPRGRARA